MSGGKDSAMIGEKESRWYVGGGAEKRRGCLRIVIGMREASA